MNITIIGSGWLALPLAQQLTEIGHDVTVTSTTADKTAQLTSQGHQALAYQLGQDLPVAMYDANVLIFANTCKDIQAYQQMINDWPTAFSPHIIYTSSTAVYQDIDASHDESSSHINTSHPTYQIEQQLKTLNATIIRLAGLVGPERHPGQFFKRGIINNGHCPLNLLHLNDAIGVICAVIKLKIQNEVINACADNHPRKADFYQQMVAQLGRPALQETHTKNSSGKIINNSKSKQWLKYHYQYPDVWLMDY